MRILLLHPEDSPWSGNWSRERWDLVVDLGFASRSTYEDWRRRLGTRVLTVYQYDGQTEGYRWVNRVLEHGRGRLLDRMGLDWWELLAVWGYQDLHMLYLLENFLRFEVPSGRVELAATRPHLFARVLGRGLDLPVRYFQTEAGAVRRLARMLQSARKLRPAQIAEIAFDKWDPGYRLRRHFKRRSRAGGNDPVVVLPSTYSNVTRSELAYARQLPQRRFLLVATRPSALPGRLPGNVRATSLAAYAVPSGAVQAECSELRKSWEAFRRTTLAEVREFQHASQAGLWDYLPPHLENGLRLREAWRHLLETEPVAGVLCGDDLNYYTRLPLLLARRCGRNAVYCSHGALDGGFLFKLPLADSYLVKGEMESDYLRRVRAVAPEKIMVGAPGRSRFADGGERPGEHRVENRSGLRDPQRGGALVFFSQPFEVESGRVEEIYREILPRLCSVAFHMGRKVIVKLHPFESKRMREALVTSILPKSLRGVVEVVGGMPPEEVMARAWCGLTVDSSVAVECALRQIPFFLCGWLDFSGMGYLEHFARFGVARVLNAPEEIENIPALVEDYRADPASLERLWQQVDPARLDEMLFGDRRVCLDPCA
jgi:hypothetical protein